MSSEHKKWKIRYILKENPAEWRNWEKKGRQALLANCHLGNSAWRNRGILLVAFFDALQEEPLRSRGYFLTTRCQRVKIFLQERINEEFVGECQPCLLFPMRQMSSFPHIYEDMCAMMALCGIGFKRTKRSTFTCWNHSDEATVSPNPYSIKVLLPLKKAHFALLSKIKTWYGRSRKKWRNSNSQVSHKKCKPDI